MAQKLWEFCAAIMRRMIWCSFLTSATRRHWPTTRTLHTCTCAHTHRLWCCTPANAHLLCIPAALHTPAGSHLHAAHTCTPCLATGVGHYAQDDEKALAMVVALQQLGVVAKFYVVANTSNAVDRACLAKGTLQAITARDEP